MTGAPDRDGHQLVGIGSYIESSCRRRRLIATSGYHDEAQVLGRARDLCQRRQDFESWRGLAQAEVERDSDAGDALAVSTVERDGEGFGTAHLPPERGCAIVAGKRRVNRFEHAVFDFPGTHAIGDFNR